MGKYIQPEIDFVSLAIEDNTNAVNLTTNQDDVTLSLNGDLSSLFGSL